MLYGLSEGGETTARETERMQETAMHTLPSAQYYSYIRYKTLRTRYPDEKRFEATGKTESESSSNFLSSQTQPRIRDAEERKRERLILSHFARQDATHTTLILFLVNSLSVHFSFSCHAFLHVGHGFIHFSVRKVCLLFPWNKNTVREKRK
jgi:hypothetical protein